MTPRAKILERQGQKTTYAAALNTVYEPACTAPFKSPLRYPGGKQRAITQIITMFPSSAYEYREPMVGGGSVYFRARSLNFAKKYWLNDKFKELAVFWQSVQDPE